MNNIKKIIFFIPILFSIFLFTNNVKAETNYNFLYSNIKKIFVDFDELQNYNNYDQTNYNRLLNQINSIKDNNYYFVYVNGRNNSSYCYYHLIYWSKTYNVNTYWNFQNTGNSIYTNILVNYDNQINSNFIYHKQYYMNSFNGFQQSSITQKTLNQGTTAFNNTTFAISSNLNRIFSTNIENFYYSGISTLNNWTGINEIKVYDNDGNENYYNNSENTIIIKNNVFNFISRYEYENLIDCMGISKIEINFDPSSLEDLDINFESQFAEHLLGEPILEYIGEQSNSYNFGQLLGGKEQLNVQNEYGDELYTYNGSYSGIFGNAAMQHFNSIKITIDLSSYGDYDYYLKFDSNLPYTINFISVLDEIDYWKTIQMDDIFGLYLMPTTLNKDLISNITMLGNYNVYIRKDYVDENNYTELQTLENYDNNNFQYKYESNPLGYLIYFKNNNYSTDVDDGYYITFDTRYYNYAIKEFPFDEPVIVNPNTGNSIKIVDDYDDYDIFTLIKISFRHFKDVLVNIIKLVSNFFNVIPIILKYFFVLILFFIVLTLIFRFLL